MATNWFAQTASLCFGKRLIPSAIGALAVLLYTTPVLAWEFYEKTSEFDDSLMVTLFVEAQEFYQAHSKSIRPLLVIICGENRTVLHIAFKGEVLEPNNSTATVRTRVGENAAQYTVMSLSSEFDVLSLLGNDNSVPFIQTMLDANSFIIAVNSLISSPPIIKFDISGLQETIEPYNDICSLAG